MRGFVQRNGKQDGRSPDSDGVGNIGMEDMKGSYCFFDMFNF